jgi:hypothetical protein
MVDGVSLGPVVGPWTRARRSGRCQLRSGPAAHKLALDGVGRRAAQAQPSSCMAIPECQIFVMCPILSPSNFMT